ncbi:hypothetical protein HBE96_02020 [Clostridium sp. P21]|uniref:Uncharacterized protein n=1 Tax=Clostridium muellerianum TaxID=2716538 RepID=A0A7Y0EDI3_9CLOT|nr:hypothetical protein [Clostridium muellerianum]NMM61494.1 hypothetical protein [Clostridium muellerianum]
MLKFYIYISLLLIVILLLFKSIHLDLHCPKKIKTIARIAIIAMSLRYAALLILFLVRNIRYLYLLKPLFFMNLIAVPLIILIVLYIFVKGHTINFSYVFIIAGILIALYVFIMIRCTCFLRGYNNLGYTMMFIQHAYIYWGYIVINTITLFIAVGFISKKSINKIGMSLVIVSSIITIAEYIMWVTGITFITQNITGDMLWMLTLVYALNRVKK